MMCNFVARTNRSKIKSNYFIHTIIVFDLPNYTNVTITITFINQAMLCHTFVLFLLENDPHKSSAIFQIDLYVFFIHMEIPNSTNKLNHVEWLSVFQNKLFVIPYGRMNHLCHHWNKCMLKIVQKPFTAVVLDGFLLLMKGSSSTARSWFPSICFGLGVTNKAAKPDCVLSIGDDGSSYKDRSSGKLITTKINETLLSWKQQLCQ